MKSLTKNLGELDYINYVHTCEICTTDTKYLEINIRKRNKWAMNLFLNNNIPQTKFEFTKNFQNLNHRSLVTTIL